MFLNVNYKKPLIINTFIKETFKPNLDEKSLKEKEAIAESQNPHLNPDIFFQIDHYINSKKHKVSKVMPRIYRNMKDHLKAFETFRKKPITFNRTRKSTAFGGGNVLRARFKEISAFRKLSK